MSSRLPVAVYPRVCGGTGFSIIPLVRCGGLSPRVRGNRSAALTGSRCWRSIPACAGEPKPCRVKRRRGTVYPRVCGGTYAAQSATDANTGLSPRVRGNQKRRLCGSCVSRSIPACAGEPRSGSRARRLAAVYPRVCGGTTPSNQPRRPVAGLSPRVRGNLQTIDDDGRKKWSIPACAGEPRSKATPRPVPRVYPRVCGGTGPWLCACSAKKGLSPRVRGNRIVWLISGIRDRSIPACAGEPSHP